MSKLQGRAGAARWVQLGCAVVCMMAISSPQYTWTLFTKPIGAALGLTLPALQVTFSLLVIVQTFLAPLQGYGVDRYGPRVLMSVGTVLSGLSWVLASRADSELGLYLSYGVLGGLGTGIVYIGAVGQMVRWFPDRRGFAVGMVAAGYGMGAIATTFPITTSIAARGYRPTLEFYGWIFAAVGLLAAQLMRPAPRDLAAPAPPRDDRSGAGPAAMLRTPLFWLLFVMMTMMSTSGLMVISQTAAFARDFGVASVTVLGMAALPLALTIDRVTNGLTRPFFGALSDRIGREPTMFIAFTLEGAAMFAWLQLRADPVWFVLLSGVVFFGWGEIFSLFPSILTDSFGPRHATANYGFLYMAQGVGSVLGGPLAAKLHDATGSWLPVFTVAICLDFAAGILALAVLRPLRARRLYA
jgi:oxalate/formate antiporter